MEVRLLYVMHATLSIGAAQQWTGESRKPCLITHPLCLFDADDYNDHKTRELNFVRANSERMCYSCMSRQYLLSWHDLMFHYYPPKSFTDACEAPESPNYHGNVSTVSCKRACLTVTENIQVGGMHISKRYMRGCMDRLLLFNMNDNLRSEMAAVGNQPLCRVINRQMMHLVHPNRGTQDTHDVNIHTDMIEVCSCLGDRCNAAPPFGHSYNRVPLSAIRPITTRIILATLLMLYFT